MTTVLGLDPGTKMGLARFGSGEPRVWTEDISGCGPIIRLGLLFDLLVKAMKSQKPDLVVMEGYAFQRNQVGSFTLGEYGGAIRLAMIAERVPFVVVASASLKKFVLGKGPRPGTKVSKIEIAVAIAERWGYRTGKNDNEYDAYALGQIGRGIMGLTEKMTVPQLEVVKKYASEVEKAHCTYDCSLNDPEGS